MAEIILGIFFVIFGLIAFGIAFLFEISHTMKPGRTPGDASDRKSAVISAGIGLALFALSGFLFFGG